MVRLLERLLSIRILNGISVYSNFIIYLIFNKIIVPFSSILIRATQ